MSSGRAVLAGLAAGLAGLAPGCSFDIAPVKHEVLRSCLAGARLDPRPLDARAEGAPELHRRLAGAEGIESALAVMAGAAGVSEAAVFVFVYDGAERTERLAREVAPLAQGRFTVARRQNAIVVPGRRRAYGRRPAGRVRRELDRCLDEAIRASK